MVILFLAGISIGIVVAVYHKDTEQKLTDLREHFHTEKKKDQTNDQPLKEEEIEKNPEATNRSLKSTISDAVQQTIDIFSRKATIVAMGDSLTEGVGDSTKTGGYIGILDRTINQKKQLATFKNFGKRGDRTDQLLQRMKSPEIISSLKEADIILITIGANDIMQVLKNNITNITYEAFANEQDNYEKRLQAIFNFIRAQNETAEVYLLGFYNPFERYFEDIKELNMIVNNWNKTGKKVTEQYDKISFIPTKDLFETQQAQLFANDNFHPNDLGYERMADRVLQFIIDKER